MTVRGIIFDFDGTLFDTMGIWQDVGSRVLRALGAVPEPGADAALRTLSASEGAAMLRARYGLSAAVPEILACVTRVLEVYYAQEASPKPGIPEVLASLQRRGIHLSIATATSRPLVESALAHWGLGRYFDGVVTCDEAGAGKSSPAVYEAACAVMGTSVGETVVVEDAPHAARTARTAGFRTAGVVDIYEPDPALLRAVSDVLLPDFLGADICDVLTGTGEKG